MFEVVSWVYDKLAQIEKTDNPRNELAKWYNSLAITQRETVLRCAGWLDPKSYASHFMDAGGEDKVFENLADMFNIH